MRTPPVIYGPLGSCGISHALLGTAVHTAVTLDPQTLLADSADQGLQCECGFDGSLL